MKSDKAKWVFADNTFIYGNVSEWALMHSGLDAAKSTWSEEPKLFLEIIFKVSMKSNNLNSKFIVF